MLEEIISKFDGEEDRIFTANTHNAESRLSTLAKGIAESEDGQPIENVLAAIDLVTDLNGDIESGKVADAEILRRVGWYRATTLQKRPAVASGKVSDWDPKHDLRFIVVPDEFKHRDGVVRYGFRLIAGNFAPTGAVSTNRLYTVDTLDEVEEILVSVYRPAIAGASPVNASVKLNPATGWIENTVHTLVGQTADISRLHRFIGVSLLPELQYKLEIERKRDERVRAQYAPIIEDPAEDDDDFFIGEKVVDAGDNEIVDDFVAVEIPEETGYPADEPVQPKRGIFGRLLGGGDDRPYLYGQDSQDSQDDDTQVIEQVQDDVEPEAVEDEPVNEDADLYEAEAVDEVTAAEVVSEDEPAEDEVESEFPVAEDDGISLKIVEAESELPAVKYADAETIDEVESADEAELGEEGDVEDLIEGNDDDTTEIPVVETTEKSFRFNF